MEQKEVWDAIAGKWSEFRTRPAEEVVEFLSGKSGVILDLGCGSGRNFIEGDLEFYGVDFSEKLLEKAGDKGYVELKYGTTDAIPYGDGVFDFVVFARVLHCVDSIEKRRKSLEEVYRVLKDGGEAVISTWGKGHSRTKNKGKEFYVPWSVGDEAHNSVLSKLGTDIPDSSGKFERYTYIYDKDEFEGQLREVGFDIVSLEEGDNIVAVVRKLG